MNAWPMIEACATHQPERREPINVILTDDEYRQVKESLQPYPWRLTLIPEEPMGWTDVVPIGGEPVTIQFEGVPQ